MNKSEYKKINELKKKAQYLQEDNHYSIKGVSGTEILPIREALKRYPWVTKHIHPGEQGYFIWVKDSPAYPIITCFLIASKGAVQRLTNLIIVEENVEVTFKGLCMAELPDLAGKHMDYTRMIMKNNAVVNIEHIHKWGNRDLVSMVMNLEAQNGSKLVYKYRSLESPRRFYVLTKAKLYDNASVNITVAALGDNNIIRMKENFELIGDHSDAILKYRVVSKNKADVVGISKISAIGNETKGHLDCQGLVLSNDTRVDLIPELESKNKTSSLTHEASIGRIAPDVLNYLRSRGLTEEDAIDLIVNGFLMSG
ncbi:MAG: SufB/SufD family protein [Candidatus Asgardarchaeia archaeon]